MITKTEYILTNEQALFIKDLRINQDHSWRAVAREVSAEYPDLKDTGGFPVQGNKAENSGNQIDGMALCDAAMKQLNETVEDGWN